MDNNFYKILQTFKQLNEATAPATASTLEEGPLDELYGELSDKYDELAPGIEKYKDEAGAERLYDELEAIAKQHGLISQFRNICNGARYSAHQEYDTNPGHFKNWFWFLPFENDLHEEPKFGGYLKGTDPAPKAGDNKAFGSCEESIEQECDTPMSPVERKLRALWAQHKKEVDENIVPTGTAAPANQQDPQKAIQDQAKMKGELDQAKSKGLLPSTTNTQQSSQALTALTQAGGDMNKVPANIKQKLAPMITGIAGALGAGAKNPAQASKVNQAMSTLGQVNKAAE